MVTLVRLIPSLIAMAVVLVVLYGSSNLASLIGG